jgi:hypothetical protein
VIVIVFAALATGPLLRRSREAIEDTLQPPADQEGKPLVREKPRAAAGGEVRRIHGLTERISDRDRLDLIVGGRR